LNRPLRALTTRYSGITRVPFVEVEFSEAFDPTTTANPPPSKKFKAIWDTGATSTVITPKIVKDLNLKPVTKADAKTAGGSLKADVCLVNLTLPNGVRIIGIPACVLPVTDGDALIGMDVISGGDFAISSEGGKSVLSFQFPSIHTIDFVKEVNESNQDQQVVMDEQEKKRQRNIRKRQNRKWWRRG